MADLSLRKQAEDIAALYTPPGTGRWSEVGDESTVRTLLEAAEDGLRDSDAAAAAGISAETLRLWRQRAELGPDSAYGALFSALKEAKARGKHWHLRNIKRHAHREWTASAWTLERTDPEQFGKRDADSSQPKVIVQIGVRDGDVSVNVMTPSPSSLPALGEGEQIP